MSDYSRSKVIRMKATKEELGVSRVYDLEDKYPELFGISDVGKFETAPTEEEFIDYVLYHTYGEECGDFGFVRELTEKELEKYIPIFQQIYPEVTKDNLRYVDYCFYNCSEAPDYWEIDEELE